MTLTSDHDVTFRQVPAAATPITGAFVHELVEILRERGWGEDIEWSQNIAPPPDAQEFALEAIFVICNSGMKFEIARKIFEKCRQALYEGRPVKDAFGHAGKVGAIEHIWAARHDLFAGFLAAEDKLAFCRGLPWIGEITQYHLAKNFGVDVAKPDVHLARLAGREGVDTHALCARLAAETGYRIATVDLILWRACATGVISSRTPAAA